MEAIILSKSQHQLHLDYFIRVSCYTFLNALEYKKVTHYNQK